MSDVMQYPTSDYSDGCKREGDALPIFDFYEPSVEFIIPLTELETALQRIAELEAEIERLQNTNQWEPMGNDESDMLIDANGVMVYLEDRYYMELCYDYNEIVAVPDDNYAFCKRKNHNCAE